MLRCSNGSFYTGYTDNLQKRYQSHIDGTGGCKYTRSFKPLEIAQSWKIAGEKSNAMRVERFIKKLSRAQKEILTKNPETLLSMCAAEQFI
jgi:putative endonuclease